MEEFLSQVLVPSEKHEDPPLVDGFVKDMISIIIPAYNEASFIARTISEVKTMFRFLGRQFEIVVVDDGSIDGTNVIVEDLNDKEVKLVRQRTNRGKGSAIKSGFQQAVGEFTFLVDGDSEIYPRNLLSFIRELKTADIVIGSKRHPMSRVHTPIARKFLSAALHVLVRLSLGVKVSDTQAGFKAVRSSAFYRILPLMSVKRFAFDLEFLTLASLLSFRTVELPVEIELNAGTSPKRIFRMFIDILGIIYRFRVRRWYQSNIHSMSSTYNPIIR